MRLFSLFAGIGGPEKALERLKIKYELVGYSEIDKYASKCYSSMFNISESLNYGDIKNIEEKNLPDFDLLTWGFPCQDISIAGRQAGIKEGNRSGLYYDGLRILKEKKPKYSIIENVKQLTSKKFRDTFEMILRDLEEAGYNNYWQVLNARDYGVPQNRERVFIVSIRKDINQSFKFPEKEVLKVKLKDLLEENVDEKFYLSDRLIKCFSDTTDRNGYVRGKRFNPYDLTKEYAFTITTSAGNRATDNYIKVPEATKKGYAEARDGDGIYINRPHQKRGCVQKEKVPTIKANPCDLGVVVENKIILEEPLVRDGWHKRNKQVINPEGISSCVVAQSNNSLQKVVVEENFITKKYNKFITENGYIPEKFNPYNEKEIVEIAPTQSTQCGSATSSSAILNYTKELRIRKLTPLECWRLMDFDDEDFYKAKETGVSNTQLYKMAGNSIVVKVIQKILENLFMKG